MNNHEITAAPERIYSFLSEIVAGKESLEYVVKWIARGFSRATERIRRKPQMVQKEDGRKQEEVYGTISDEEWNKMVEETLRKDKKLLEKLAKI